MSSHILLLISATHLPSVVIADPRYLILFTISGNQGVRQGCVKSPDLLLLYSESFMKSITDNPGIRMKGCNLNNLCCADDTVLRAGNENDQYDMLNTGNRE